jgi:hypothetical protein
VLSDSNSELTTQSDLRYFRSVAKLGVQIAEALRLSQQRTLFVLA